MSRKKILFISHDASRTGAPKALLHLLRWLKDHTDLPFDVLLKNGGELEGDFTAIAPTYHYQRLAPGEIQKQFSQETHNLIYSNTVVNGQLLRELSHLKRPVITHVHELEHNIRYVNGETFGDVLNFSHHFIAVSGAVKDNLVRNHGVASNRVHQVYGSIQIPEDLGPIRAAGRALRERLGISDERFLVAASGTTDWRKGPDLFIHLARIAQKQAPDQFDFIWVGGDDTGTCYHELMHDVQKARIANNVRFLGTVQNPLEYFASCDAFCIVSREDPFPLVMLEAAAVGKPIICFEDSGGAPEFIRDECGATVPYLDLEKMVETLVLWRSLPKIRTMLGTAAADKVRKSHDICVSGPKIAEIIRSNLQRAGQ